MTGATGRLLPFVTFQALWGAADRVFRQVAADVL